MMRTTLLASIFVLAACGGGNSAVDPSALADAGGAAATNGGGGGGAGSVDAGAPSTTLMLGDGGELQGTKLQQHGSVVMQTSSNDAGSPGPLDKAGEPGRRPSDIQTIILTRRDDARACYDAERKKNPNITEGNLDIGWVIDPKGNVTNAEVIAASTEIKEPAVSSCIIAIIKGIKFNESTKGFETKAHYPFNFKRNVAPKKP